MILFHSMMDIGNLCPTMSKDGIINPLYSQVSDSSKVWIEKFKRKISIYSVRPTYLPDCPHNSVITNISARIGQVSYRECQICMTRVGVDKMAEHNRECYLKWVPRFLQFTVLSVLSYSLGPERIETN